MSKNGIECSLAEEAALVSHPPWLDRGAAAGKWINRGPVLRAWVAGGLGEGGSQSGPGSLLVGRVWPVRLVCVPIQVFHSS